MALLKKKSAAVTYSGCRLGQSERSPRCRARCDCVCAWSYPVIVYSQGVAARNRCEWYPERRSKSAGHVGGKQSRFVDVRGKPGSPCDMSAGLHSQQI